MTDASETVRAGAPRPAKAAAAGVVSVCICIPTFRRPRGLARLLAALPRLEGRFVLDVVVADNDPEGREGLAVAREFAEAGYALPLTAVPAPERGIAQARNVLIATALAKSPADYIAMLDDDCRPDPGWLAALMEIIAETGADMANGRVAHAIEGGAEDAAGTFWERLRRPRPRGPVGHLLGGIALVSRSVFERIEPPWFEPQYGLSGGEDEDFFLRAAAEGCTAAYTPDAVVTEFVPASRMTPRYLAKRAFAQGMTYTYIRRWRRPSGWSAGGEAVRIAASLGLGAVGYVLLFWSLRHRRRAAWRIARAAGKACGMAGRPADFYRLTQGR